MTEIPGFEIKRELGSSAAATVYLALQTSLDREVALKIMVPGLVEDVALTQRFIQEARTLASLAHPHIVAVYDVDTAPDRRPYFSMQYLPGGDLAARVGRGMSESALIETLEGVAQALDYVHQRGLVHRDVRPTNVLYDDSGVPILTDFGIARAVGSAASTGTDFSAATGHYISPEQARGGSLDARADLYSLGALTWFGLTGRPPYEGADGFAVAYAHVFEAIPRLPKEKAHWQPLIDRALAKEPAQRFASAREFLDAIAQVSTGASGAAVADEAATQIAPVPTAAQIESAAATASSNSYATQQGSLPDLSAPASPVAGPAVSEPSVRQPANAEAMRSAEAPAAPAPPAGPTITRRRPVLPAPAPRAPANAGEAPRVAARWWPLAAIAAGVAAIGFTLYWQFGGPSASRRDAEPPSAQVAANVPVAAAAPIASPAPSVPTATAPTDTATAAAPLPANRVGEAATIAATSAPGRVQACGHRCDRAAEPGCCRRRCVVREDR
ncbi:MAG: serine/threonine protein kinase [Gammaproteobacteria bacterium]|nr:MAG: serine/threonine protein kinase [Gammaproteobacteria bacterium]